MSSSTSKSGSFSHWQTLIAITIVALGACGFYVYRQVQGNAQTAAAEAVAAQVPRRTLVHALGRLEPAGRILQLAPKSGNENVIVEHLFVQEGDDVEAGTTLAVLDNQDRRLAALHEAQSMMEAAEARLLQVKAGAKVGEIAAQQAAVNLAEAQAKVARRDLVRAQELQQKNAISVELVDQRQWEFDRLQLEQSRAAGLLESLCEVRDVDVAVAEKEIAAARAAVARAQADADASELKAPFAGRVLRIHTRAGEKISAQGILEMGDVLRMQAVAEVFEGDVGLIETGMSAEIRIDSSDEVFSGRVVEIGQLVARKIVLTNDPVSDTDARVIEVRVDLDPAMMSKVVRLSNARVEVQIHLDSPPKDSSNRDSTGIVTPALRTVSEQKRQ